MHLQVLRDPEDGVSVRSGALSLRLRGKSICAISIFVTTTIFYSFAVLDKNLKDFQFIRITFDFKFCVFSNTKKFRLWTHLHVRAKDLCKVCISTENLFQIFYII